MSFRVGIDTGGTFTDLIALEEDSREVRVAKVLSTPERPADALLNALDEAQIPLGEVGALIHGTTVATNALLERKGARVAFLTTAGFEDVPFIQRIRREYHYDLMWAKPQPLVERYNCYGITERVDYQGTVVIPLGLASLEPVVAAGNGDASGGNIDRAIDAVAICYLFSYLMPAHEQATLDYLQDALPDLPISISSQIAPIWREYERASTTIADAYLRPLMTRYIRDLDARLAENGLPIEWSLMKSNGGIMPAITVTDNAIHTIMSGPAGGMIACRYFADLTGDQRVITLDMGGTSCDVGLLDDTGSFDHAEQRYTTEFEIEWGIPINVPLIDIKTIGAGGGSIAWTDAGGLLHVGPESAGATPGPICYNQGGDRPTVTDANTVLGRVVPDRFIDHYDERARQRAHDALAEVGATLGMSAMETALAIVEIANANMGDAIKLMTLERGLDPRHFALLAFGGAGPLHAGAIARALEIPRVMVPPHPGICSALGMLVTDLRVDKVMTYPTSSEQATAAELADRLQSLIGAAGKELASEGFQGTPQVHTLVSMRYLGQNYEEEIPVVLAELQQGRLAQLFDAFHQHHERRYGYQIADEVIEIVALKVTLVGPVVKPRIEPSLHDQRGEPESHQAYFKDVGWVECPIYQRESLPVGSELTGPAIVEEYGCTTLVEPGQRVHVDEHGVLTILGSG